VCSVARATEFTVRLRGDAGWSLEETSDQRLVVSSLDVAGASSEYNAMSGVCPTRKIRLGCVIAEVDGIRGDGHELLYLLEKALGHGGGYSVVFKQPTEFMTTVARNSKSLGLELALTEVDTFLRIQEILPQGAVMEHNRSNAREELKSFDRIIEVNGIQGSGRDLLKCIRDSEVCTMRICRLPGQ